MAETPRLDLPYIAASQFQKEVVHNQSLDRLDILAQCAVLDRNLATPPASPAPGDAYIVAASPTGAWAGHANELALWVSSQWQLIAPLPGFLCWVIDEAVQVYWSGSAWTIVSGGGGGATTLLGLTDTPDSYAGQAGKTLLVNPGETGVIFGTLAGSAPIDATYIVSSTNSTLTAERVVTTNTQIAWDTATAGQLAATLADHGVSLDKLAQQVPGTLLGRGDSLNPVDDVQPIVVGPGLEVVGTTLQIVGGAGGIETFLELTDTPDAYAGQAGKAVLVNAGATGLEFGTAGAGTFLALSDTPDAYTGQGGKVVAVKTDASGLEFITGGGGGGTPSDGAKVTRAANQSVSATTLTAVSFDTETLDQGTYWSSGQPTRLTVAQTGWYTVGAEVTWATNATGSRDLNIRLNGTTFVIADRTQNAGSNTNLQAIAGVLYLTAGDYLELVLFHNGSGALNVTGDMSLMRAGAISGGVSDFLSLTDTPNAYTGQGSNLVTVNSGATALDFTTLTPAGRALLDDADAAAQRTTLGLGTLATQHAASVAITGGTVTGLTGFSVTGGPAAFLGVPLQLNSPLGLSATPSSAVALFLAFAKATQLGIVLKPNDTDTGQPPVLFQNVAAATVGSITTTASTTAFNTSSDVRLKEGIATLVGALDVIRALHPVSFRWQADSSQGHGFLAHELMTVVPEAVSGLPDEVHPDGTIKPQQVDHSRLVVWLTAALKETLAQVETLTARIATLEEALGV